MGLKEGFTIRLINAPSNYYDLFPDWPLNITTPNNKTVKKDFIHFFTSEAEELFLQLPLLKNELLQNGMLWVSWPKKAAKVPTDVTEDVIRYFALEIGLADVKVCAVDATWSGLKLVIPVAQRKK